MFKHVLDLALSKRLVFVTGKGGIGKSILASSLALQANLQGKSVLLVQQAASDHLGPLFGLVNVGHEAIQARSGLEIANFTPGLNFRDFVVKHLKHGSLFDVIARNRVIHGFFTAIPGFGELMLLGRLYYTLNLAPIKPDLVIVDGYSSGHFQSLMTTPEAVLQSGLAGPIMAETKRVDEFLRKSDECAALIVGVPEELVVTEMVELIDILAQKSPVKAAGVIFNRCLSSLDQESEVGDAQVFLKRRFDLQQAAWRAWNDAISDVSWRELPVFKAPELGFINDPLSEKVAARLVLESFEGDLHG